MTSEELQDPVYLRGWCIDQATMVLKNGSSLAEIIDIATGLENFVKAAIPPKDVPDAGSVVSLCP
ncbi:hypothetical protein [Komagataeibacter sp. FNDCR2]|uniref:hypothetical protein n=1 Tax=Komagataeibacter sp. FNDCR2 TaxID=2878682 RepID=UPI001E30B040|nr:hypothetical protein [Komagataeibacter sp. FNDCR2]MCE2576046.1 hypothetical protein [Komagataeibacter sp. FNDCR2]